jgi:hypothetical protein
MIEKEKIKTRIISAFPGMGKSYIWSLNMETCLDLDSNDFQWKKKPNGENSDVINLDFINNYLFEINENIGKYEFIFIDTYIDIREALINECLFFYLIYPISWLKDDFIKRYYKKKNSQAFINLISSNWENWINEMMAFEDDNAGHSNWATSNLYLSDVLKNIIESENDIVKTKFE